MNAKERAREDVMSVWFVHTDPQNEPNPPAPTVARMADAASAVWEPIVRELIDEIKSVQDHVADGDCDFSESFLKRLSDLDWLATNLAKEVLGE